MCAMKTLVAKVLVFLLAGLVCLQPLPVDSCGCTTSNGPSRGTGDQPSSVETKPCCDRPGHCCCAKAEAASHSCCRADGRMPVKSPCGCDGACRCQSNDAPPPQPQAPPQNGPRVVDQLTQSLAADSSKLGDLQLIRSFRPADGPSGDSGFERCITLCRFNL